MIVDPVQALADIPTPIMAAKPHHTSPPIEIVPSVDLQQATENGHRTLWVVFVIMLIATLAFIGMAWSVPVSKRLYHIITTFIVLFATVSYFAMASGDGISYKTTKIVEKHKHVPDTTEYIKREVYWARYVDWSLTTPLLLLDLALVAGLNGAHILILLVADVGMILTGLFAAFGKEGTPQKWGYYAWGCIFYLALIYVLAVHGRAHAFQKSRKLGGFFASIAGFTLILWTAYPIIWGIADGSRKVNVDTEIILYAILDVLAKPIFGLWLLLTHINLPETNVELGGFWAHGLGSEGTIRVGDDEEGA